MCSLCLISILIMQHSKDSVSLDVTASQRYSWGELSIILWLRVKVTLQANLYILIR